MTDDAIARALDETLLWLCSIDSPIGEERAICDAVAERVTKISLGTRRYGNSIVVPVSRATGGPKIALVGHLDTVRTENGPARIEGDRCFGAGSSDMKSGLALMLVLGEHLKTFPCDLTLVFYAREEGPFAENELGPVLEQDPELRRVDFAVCLEPSDNRLHLGCMGSIHATITFTGRTAHSARPWEGESALFKALPFLSELAARAPEVHVIEGLTYRSVFTVTQIRDGGRGRNIVPDKLILNLNHRFPPSIALADAQQAILHLVAKRADVIFSDLSPGAMPSREHPLVQSLIASGVRSVEPKHAWTDVARFAALGIPAVNFGPGENAQAHQKNESTSLRLVHEGYAILQRWLLGLAAS